MSDISKLKKNPLLFYIRANKRSFILGMIFLLITNFLDAVSPLILKMGIDQVTTQVSSKELLKTVTIFFLAMAGLAFTRFCWRTFFGRYHTLAAEDLRNRLFRHLGTMGPNFFHKNPVGELMSLITNDVQSFRQGIGGGVLVLVDAVTITAIILPVMFMMNAAWTWKTLIFLPLVPVVIWKVTEMIFSSYKIQQDQLSELAGNSQEIVSGIRVIKSFSQEQTKLAIYNKISRKFEGSSNSTAMYDALFSPVMEFGVASGSVILLFLAADDVLSGVVSIGTLVAFQRYIQKMVWPMTALGLGLSQFKKGMASFSRIRNVLDQETDVPNAGTIELKTFESLQVKNLSYRFPGSQHQVLKNISFSIAPGETVGLVGPVGSGKTTLLYLLNRLYPSEPNQIFVNGHSIEKIEQRSLHSQLVLIPQEAFLFSDTIHDNIHFIENSVLTGQDLHEQVRDWARVVDIESEIESLPMKFESHLGERGVNLSGGQKQRLTIARGLVVRAPLIMMDDSLSAVDTKTEKSIQDRLNQSHGRRQSKLIVSHRLTSVESADKIIVLREGEIEAMGTHQELLKISPTYSGLALLQEENESGATHE
jgi:ATP-binding cassette, subfamily B, multidrug efflux pump